MEILVKRYNSVHAALVTLKEAIDALAQEKSPIMYGYIRDSVIQRFEYSVDTFWKLLKLYMQEKNLVDTDASFPRAIIREAASVQLITQQEFNELLEAIADRNLTSHIYNLDLAEEIAARAPNHYAVMMAIINRLRI